MRRYKVAVWDHEDGRWSCALAALSAEGPARGLSRAEAIAVRRKLYRQGWGTVSVVGAGGQAMNFGEMADVARDAAIELEYLRPGRPSSRAGIRALTARLASLDFGGGTPAALLVRDAIIEAGGEAPAGADGLAAWVDGVCCWLHAAVGDGSVEKEEGARLRAFCVALSGLATVRAARGYVRRERPKEST